MSKNIAISEDVYRALKREKGDRSFSYVLKDRLEDGRKLADVTGAGVLDPEAQKAVKGDIEQMSQEASTQTDDERL